MDLIHSCCAGLDVHKKTVVACARRLGPDGQVASQVRTFRTMTADLIALGCAPGPALGRLLRELEDAQLEGRLADREAALALARARLANG